MSIEQKAEQSTIKSKTDPAVEGLVSEAQALFNILDAASTKIRDLEKKLTEIKAHFPFSYRVCKENMNLPIDTHKVEMHKRQAEPFIYIGYNTYLEQSISWEEDDKSEKFRLFLVARRQEFTIVDIDADPAEEPLPLVNEVVFKKPLIESDLPTRLKYIEHLHSFIKKFKEHLQHYRKTIEGKLVDFNDEIPPF